MADHSSLDVGRKLSPIRDIMESSDIDIMKANNVLIKSLSRAHRSQKKLKLKKPKKMDIFFGHEIQLESERMLNIDTINMMRLRQQYIGDKAVKASMRPQYGPNTFG